MTGNTLTARLRRSEKYPAVRLMKRVVAYQTWCSRGIEEVLPDDNSALYLYWPDLQRG